jgi:cytochrome c-type biogenesis protein CcmH
LILLTFLTFIFITPAHAQTPPPTPIPDDAVNTISRKLYCPVCQNVTLEVCPTEACSRWREQVRLLIAEGKNEAEIQQYFIDRFGMRTVGVPTDTTGQILAIGVPFTLVLLIGGWLALRIMRRGRLNLQTEAITLPDDPDLDTDYAARLERELKERR